MQRWRGEKEPITVVVFQPARNFAEEPHLSQIQVELNAFTDSVILRIAGSMVGANISLDIENVFVEVKVK